MSVTAKIIPQEIIRLKRDGKILDEQAINCLLYTSPSPRD